VRRPDRGEFPQRDDLGPGKAESRLGGQLLASVLPFVLCAILVLGRYVVGRAFGYLFILWNLFLAWVPLCLAILARSLYLPIRSPGRKTLIGLLWIVWLLFLPNAPYVTTDFVHIANKVFLLEGSRGYETLLWYDIITVASCAFVSLLAALSSLDLMEGFAAKILGRGGAFALTLAICLLSGFGLYIGRFVRLNTWDLFVDPSESLGLITDSMLNRMSLGFSAISGCYVLVSYLAFRAAKHHRRVDED
jgi:uncharacterized membrane protein